MDRVLSFRALAALLTSLSACTFDPDIGEGRLVCAVGTRPCPEGYYCAEDNRCRRSRPAEGTGGRSGMPGTGGVNTDDSDDDDDDTDTDEIDD